MIVTGISLKEFTTLVAKISADAYDNNLTVDPNTREFSPNRFRARTRMVSSREAGARRSASGRRGPYACWHVTRDVVRGIMALNPDARVQSSLATYRGSDDFEESYRDTASMNIGSMMYPAYMPELCDC